MKIAILGAGFSGLTAAYELNKAGHKVTIYEKNAQPGGAAGGFKEEKWEWYLDFAYHHWFTNDSDVLGLCKEIGWEKIVMVRPVTASLYSNSNDKSTKSTNQAQNSKNKVNSNLAIQQFSDSVSYKLDSPLDLLKFPRIPVIDRIRAGIVLALLKFGPPLQVYHRTTSYKLLTTLMGKTAFDELFKPLFEKKFGEYAPYINTMFMWARITKRTPSLAYPEGGYQALANHFSRLLVSKGVTILYSTEVKTVTRASSQFSVRSSQRSTSSQLSNGLKTKKSELFKNSELETENYDVLINTLPSPIFLKLEKNILPDNYRTRLAGIKYLGAQTVILETKEPVLDKTYWLNLTQKNNPWMVAIQHTNFMDKKHFNGHHLFYLATYTNKPLTFRHSDIQTRDARPSDIIKKWEFTIPYAQPIYTTNFIDHVPHYKTPVPGLYFANMEMTYPYDRGTNYAVKVGREVARIVNSR
ncbi:MAG: FAD-dependent oxidoreductase [Patescibacteria group bacterium]|jgi:protoporphyrinogen oxidase